MGKGLGHAGAITVGPDLAGLSRGPRCPSGSGEVENPKDKKGQATIKTNVASFFEKLQLRVTGMEHVRMHFGKKETEQDKQQANQGNREIEKSF